MARRAYFAVRFGDFLADLNSGEIHKHRIRLKVQPQVFEVLAALLERPGELVTRDELRARLWPDGVFLDYERGLNKAVNRLRDILGDSVEQPRFVETVPQRGYRFTAPVVALPAIRSIAVLPLENLSGAPEEDYFSDGMTDELIGELAQTSSLRVISRTSVIRYKGAHGTQLPEIAQVLGVDAIVEGTVTRLDNRVRITAQVIRGADDCHLWSKAYERAADDLLTLRAELARTIAIEIGASLREATDRVAVHTRRLAPEAHEALLKGRFFLHQNIRGTERSIEWFRRAIELDPTYSEPYAGLAQALIFAGIYEFRPFAESYSEARVAARKAVELEPANASAHNALADISKGLDWDFKAAERQHRLALAYNPSHLLARLWFAETLSRLERHEEALRESALACELDPVSPLSHNSRSMFLWRARRYDEAIAESSTALDLDPSHVNALWWQGLAYAGNGEVARAVASLERGHNFSKAPVFLASLGYVHGLAGETKSAFDALEALTELQRSRYVSWANFATVYAGLGDADKVFEALHKAKEARDGRVHQLVWPCFDRFRGDSRFAKLKAGTGLACR